MDILLFGGNSSSNQPWINRVKEQLAPDFDKIVVHNYDHWQKGEGFIDFAGEHEKLEAETAELGEYVVFAKSVGTVLTLMGISSGVLRPVKCIFAGLPIKIAEEGRVNLKELLKDNNVPTLFIQNRDDPIASFQKLQEYLQMAEARNFAVTELGGNTHSYSDLETLEDLTQSFIFSS